MMLSVNKQNWILGGGIVIFSFLFFQFCYPYHLFFKEQIQLFIFSSDYFFSYFAKPAWLTRYAGDFMTQFFYLKGGGATILSIMLFFEWLLTAWVLRRITASPTAFYWALIPAITDLILYLELLHPVSSSLSYLLVICLFLIYSSAPNHWLFPIALLISFGGYWTIGNSVFLFPFLVILFDWREKRMKIFKWLAVVLIIFLIPLIVRERYFLTLSEAYYFPEFSFQILMLTGGLILLIVLIFSLKKIEIIYQSVIRYLVFFIAFIILLIGFNQKANFNLEKILSFDSEYYFGNYDRVIEMAKTHNLKNKYSSYYTNLALSQKSQLPERLLDFYQPMSMGMMLPVDQEESWQSIFFSNEVFFLVGDMNLAQHSAMLGMTFSPYQRSSRMVKRLAEINLLNEDPPAALKYLRLLDKTLFHKRWAAARIRLLNQVNENKWLQEKRSLLPQKDTIRKSNDYITSLNYLVTQNHNNSYALDYLLCYYLLNKDLTAFKSAYDLYWKTIPRTMPSLYSEALLIQLFKDGSFAEDRISYSIPAFKVKDFMEYTSTFEMSDGDLNKLRERFGNTYWFYYHFATLQKR